MSHKNEEPKLFSIKSFGGEEITVKQYICEHLDGSYYDRGQLEEIETTSNNMVNAIASLLSKLVDKKILSKQDIVDIRYDI